MQAYNEKICLFTNIFVILQPQMQISPSKIWKSSSARNAGKLLSANVIAQAIGIIIYPILTRLYTPEDFALLSLFVSISGVIILIATAEYQYAIVLPEKETNARALVQLCTFLLCVVVAGICFTLPFSTHIAALFNAPALADWWGLMPLTIAGLGLWNILNYWYIRRASFTRISGYQITQSLFSATGKIGFGYAGWLSGGMIIATALAPILSLCISIGLVWKKQIRELFTLDKSAIRYVAKEYANFPKFNLPRALVNSAGQYLPIWLLTPCFGLAQMGQLSLALLAAFVPLSIIARACYQVLFQRVSELVRKQQSLTSLLSQFILWTVIGLALLLPVIYIFMPQLVTFLFGSEWLEAADVIRRLYPYIVLTPICGAICFLSDVFAKQKIALWLEIGYMIATTIALLIGIHVGNFLIAVSLFAWARFAFLVIQLIWFGSLVRNYHKTLS